MHAMLDLESCYYRQTPELCCVIETVIEVNRKAVKFINKVLPRMKHHEGTANGVSKKSEQARISY